MRKLATQIYIFDSHRPLNLHNAFSSNSWNITVMYDNEEVEDEGLERENLKAAFAALEV